MEEVEVEVEEEVEVEVEEEPESSSSTAVVKHEHVHLEGDNVPLTMDNFRSTMTGPFKLEVSVDLLNAWRCKCTIELLIKRLSILKEVRAALFL